MDKYEVFLERGRLFALDTDEGTIYWVITNGRRVFSSIEDDSESPYEIYENETGDLMCINTDTGVEFPVELEAK